MKTKNVVLTLAAVIVASVFTFAAEPSSQVAVINQNNSGVYKLIYVGSIAGKVTVTIYDSNNNVLFSESTRGLSKFMRPLNFNGLEHGEYSIEITDANGTQVQKVNYNTSKIAIAEKTAVANEIAVKTIHITKLQGSGKYLMSAAGNGKINVLIFDSNDELIHDEKVTINGSLGLVYSMKEVQGEPTFRVIDIASNKRVK